MNTFLINPQPHYRKPGEKLFDESPKKVTKEDITRMMELIDKNNEIEEKLAKQAENDQ